MSAYRTSLHKEVRGYRTDLVAAKAHKLHKETARLEKLIKADEKMIGDINMWTAGVRVFGTKGKGTGTGTGGDGTAARRVRRRRVREHEHGPAPPPVITATDVASTLAQFMPFTQTLPVRRGTWSVPGPPRRWCTRAR